MLKLTFIFAVLLLVSPCLAMGEAEYTWYREILGYTPKSWYSEMAVDKQGELWILNNGRVFNFNGATWEDYTEKAGGANQISLSPDGVLWFASLDKLIRYDGNQWDYFEMDFDNTTQVLSSISAAMNNVVWLAVNNRSGYGYNLVKFDNGKFEFFTDGFLNPFLGQLTATKDGGVWVHINTYGWLDCNDDNCPIGVSYFDGITITNYLYKDNTLPGLSVSFMAYSPLNDDLYGLCNGNIVKFSNGKWEILFKGSYKEIMYEGMMVNGGDGNIWQGSLGTYYNSYLMCMKKNGQWITYDVSEIKTMLFKEDPNPFPSSFAVTSDGSVWMSYSSGLFRINSKSLNVITSVKNENPVPVSDKLSCYPNPFNSSATIKYYLDKDSPVTVEIYNSLGQKIRNVLSRNMKSGFNYATWNGLDDNGERVSTGFYTVVIRFSDKLLSQKILFLK